MLDNQHVHLYLTNDYLLITAKKKRSAQPSPYKHHLLNAIYLPKASLSSSDGLSFQISIENEVFNMEVEDAETKKFWMGILQQYLVEAFIPGCSILF